MPHIVTHTFAEYVDRAVALGTNATMREVERAELAEKRVTAPLFHKELNIRALERAIENAVARDRAGLEPAHMEIDADYNVVIYEDDSFSGGGAGIAELGPGDSRNGGSRLRAKALQDAELSRLSNEGNPAEAEDAANESPVLYNDGDDVEVAAGVDPGHPQLVEPLPPPTPPPTPPPPAVTPSRTTGSTAELSKRVLAFRRTLLLAGETQLLAAWDEMVGRDAAGAEAVLNAFIKLVMADVFGSSEFGM